MAMASPVGEPLAEQGTRRTGQEESPSGGRSLQVSFRRTGTNRHLGQWVIYP